MPLKAATTATLILFTLAACAGPGPYTNIEWAYDQRPRPKISIVVVPDQHWKHESPAWVVTSKDRKTATIFIRASSMNPEIIDHEFGHIRGRRHPGAHTF